MLQVRTLLGVNLCFCQASRPVHWKLPSGELGIAATKVLMIFLRRNAGPDGIQRGSSESECCCPARGILRAMSVTGARREFVAQDLDRVCAGGAGVGSVVIPVSRSHHPGSWAPPGRARGGGGGRVAGG
jgi:hypothetical protein